jgi:hypothetical protein
LGATPPAGVGTGVRGPVTPGRLAERFVGRAASESYLVLLVSALASLLLLALGYLVTVDTWLALVSGRLVAGGGPPSSDSLTAWTLGRDWIDQQWLGQYTLYELWRAGGLALVSLVHVAVVICTFAWTLVAARRRGGSTRAVALVGLLAAMPIYLVAGNIRAQTFALPLFVGLLLLLSAESRSPTARTFWILPILALWANLHGSVLLGAGLVVLMGVVELVRGVRCGRFRAHIARGSALLAIVVVALMATPYGLSLLTYFHSIFANPEIAKIASDWMPTDLTPINAPFYVLAGLTLALIGRERQRLTSFEQLTLVLLLAAALNAGRNLAWFALAAVVLVPTLLTAQLRQRSGKPPPVPLAASISAASILAVVAAAVTGIRNVDHQVGRRFPPAAAARVAQEADRDPSLVVFAHPRYADWLLFGHPRLAGRIPFDIRYELLTAEELRRYRRFRDQIGADWRRSVGEARLIVLDSSEKPLDALPPTSAVLLRERGARLLYAGHKVAVVLRPDGDAGQP